jgi:hypothetical protein
MIVGGKAIGQRRPLFAEFSVPPPDEVTDGGGVTLRELITTIVLHEVEHFKERQSAQRFDRVLTQRQIDVAAERGRVAPEGRDIDQKVDPDEAVTTALQAFEDGMYLVVVDEQEHRDLDAAVFLQPESRITFVRLTFLAGA